MNVKMNVKIYNEDMYEYNFENIDNIFNYIDNNILKKYEGEMLSYSNLSSMKYEISAFIDFLIERRLLRNKYYVNVHESGGTVTIFEPYSITKHTKYINFYI